MTDPPGSAGINTVNTSEVGIPLKVCVVQESLGEEGALFSAHNTGFLMFEVMGCLLHAWKSLEV